jgi:hypothetical protein
VATWFSCPQGGKNQWCFCFFFALKSNDHPISFSKKEESPWEEEN